MLIMIVTIVLGVILANDSNNNTTHSKTNTIIDTSNSAIRKPSNIRMTV